MALPNHSISHTSWHAGRLQRFLILSTLCLVGIALVTAAAPLASAQSGDTVVTGFVYYDLNGNGQPDPGEPRAAMALVDGAARPAPGTTEAPEPAVMTTTDANGNYALNIPPLVPAQMPVPNASAIIGLSSAVKNAVGTIVAGGTSSTQFAPGETITVNIGLRFTGQPHPGCVTCDYFPQTGYEVAFGDYFDRRGGVGTFGYPISRLFLLQGFPTQIFQRAVLQQWPDGSVHLLNLLDPGLLPFTSFNGAVVPAFDPTVVAQAPTPGSPDYGSRILDFVAATAPDLFDGRTVNFHQTFLNTVTAAAAFPPIPPPAYCQQHGLPASSCTTPPGYGDPSLLPGFDLEIWGIPTSHPMVDPTNSQFIYQRFQRGIMHYQGNLGVTEGLLLGEYFKSVLTGQNLPADLAQEATGSPYLRQYCATGPHWICRPDQLDPSSTDLTGAFEPETNSGQ